VVQKRVALDELSLATREEHEHIDDFGLQMSRSASAANLSGERLDFEFPDPKTTLKLWVHAVASCLRSRFAQVY
jgi:hypothetical protein